MDNDGVSTRETDRAGRDGLTLGVMGLAFLTVGVLMLVAHVQAGGLIVLGGLGFAILSVGLGLLGIATTRRGDRRRVAWMSLALGVAILVGVVVVVQWVSYEVHQAFMAEIKSNGKNMYTAVFADAVDAHAVGFPRSDAHSNATDYVLALAAGETRIVPAGPDYFSCPGMRSAESWEAFGPEHCGWSFVADLDESTPAGIPFAISSNVRGDTLADLKGRIGDTTDPGHPMGTRFVVVAYHGGQIRILTRRDKWEEALIDLGEFADQPILRP